MSILARVRAWRQARYAHRIQRDRERWAAARQDPSAGRDPLTRWLTNLPPEDRKAVPDADTRPVRSRWKAATP